MNFVSPRYQAHSTAPKQMKMKINPKQNGLSTNVNYWNMYTSQKNDDDGN